MLFTNAVLCLPAKSNGKFPVRTKQLDLCGGWLEQLIGLADPLVVVAFGAQALSALDRLHPHHLRLRQAAGRLHPWAGRQLLPLYHPGRLGRLSRTAEQQLADVAVLKSVVPPR
ncbi:MAG: uracil-DNA glycosylase family protein [Myxococcales bacterium]